LAVNGIQALFIFGIGLSNRNQPRAIPMLDRGGIVDTLRPFICALSSVRRALRA
jgi:hypothetical protein